MKKRLYRSRDDSMLGGVAAGLADYFDVDIALVRLVWLVLVFFGGSGILAYIVAWIVIPEEPTGSRVPPIPGEETNVEQIEMDDEEALNRRRRTGGLLLVALGAFFLLNQTFVSLGRLFHSGWPLIIVLIGAYLIYDSTRGQES